MAASPVFAIGLLGQVPRDPAKIADQLTRFRAAGGTIDDLVAQINSAGQKSHSLFYMFGDPASLPLIEAIDDYSKVSVPVLLAAVREGRMDLIDLYIERGADLEGSNDYGVALVAAANHLVPERAQAMVERLLRAGADPNITHHESGYTPLMHAAGVGYQEVVRMLLEAGADVRRTCLHGETALHKVVCPRFTSGGGRHRDADPVAIAKMLLDHGAVADARSFQRMTPLLSLASYGTQYARPLLKLLLDAGANLEARNQDGLTALLLAAQSNAVDAVAALLDAGADVQATTKAGTGLNRLGNADTRRLVKSLAMAQRIESAMDGDEAPTATLRRSSGLSPAL